MQMGLGNRFQGEKYPPGFRMGSWRGTENSRSVPVKQWLILSAPQIPYEVLSLLSLHLP